MALRYTTRLWQKEALALLAPHGQCGWMDGGCAILAHALTGLIGESLRPELVAVVDARGVAHHWCARIEVGVEHAGGSLHTAWYLDGDGAQSAGELLTRQAEEEGVDGPRLLAPPHARLSPDTPRSPCTSQLVHAYLRGELLLRLTIRRSKMPASPAKTDGMPGHQRRRHAPNYKPYGPLSPAVRSARESSA